jgi:mono/diheme cytochrome c family protein
MRAILLLIALISPARPPRTSAPPPRPAPTVTPDTKGARAPLSDPTPLSVAESRKAEALLRDHLPCLGCHTLNGTGGKVGPDLTTVRTRRSAEYIASIVSDPARVVPAAAMPRTLMLPVTRDLIIRYLQTRPGTPAGAMPAPLPAPAATTVDGAALYTKWCASCHGLKGKGDGPNAPNLPVKPATHADGAAMSRRPDDSLYDTIAGGGEIMNRSPRMPAFGASLTPAEIRALVAHIRTLCRCQGPAWSRDDAPAR